MTTSTEQQVSIDLRPLHDRVVILPEKPEQITKGGIIVPDSAQKRAEAGTVLAAGPGEWSVDLCQRIPLTVKAGDRVAFGRYAGSEMEIDGETVWIMREAEILGILGPDVAVSS